MNRVLVTGATGQIGVFLLPRLLRAGHSVTAISRRLAGLAPWSPQGLQGRLVWTGPDPADMGPGHDAAAGVPVDAIVSAGPLPLAVRWSRFSPSVKRIVCFSSSSVLVKADSPDPGERAMIGDLVAAERDLRTLCTERGLSLVLMRPTLIFGCGLDRNLSRVAALARRFGFVPVAGAAGGLRQPVHADDLAALAVAALSDASAVDYEGVVPGPDTLSYRAMVEAVFRAFDRPPRTPALPESLLALFARLGGTLLRTDGLNAQAVRRQNVDLCFDSDAWQRFGVEPRPFRPTRQDFRIPEAVAALQAPR